MNEKEQQEYLEKYKKAKEKGVPFFPDILFKDAVVSLVVFLGLVALASFVGAPLEERADPTDTSYTPQPEWYFLFLFQLLKHFPGELDIIGVVVIPTLVLLLLFFLPLLDRGPRRHFRGRPWVTGITVLMGIGIILLTVQSLRENPPPADTSQGDRVAALYTENCAACHGPKLTVPTGTNLHAVIAQGTHEGMPAWNADLTTDEIDALAGFVLSPGGNELFVKYCNTCHEAADLVAGDPIELKNALEGGSTYLSHAEVDIPEWTEVMSAEERALLLNFLIAPDGQRLFSLYCSSCHGRSVAYTGEEGTLAEIIRQGGLHLEMPPWREQISASELDTLASYVVDPASAPGGQALFERYCISCHGQQRIPYMPDFVQAHEAIASGGAHETMPVWGEILTSAQVAALVEYTLNAAKGTPLEVGLDLFSSNCAPCHGDFGEGGPNPTRPDDVIAPISTAEYLKTRDDFTLYAIIAQGQPNFGMSPFGSGFGGPLEDDEINAIVAYMRAWESNPPVELPPEVQLPADVTLSGREIYASLCSQCHAIDGSGGIGPSLSSQQFKGEKSAQDIFDDINYGHPTTAMIAWGKILTAEQIQQLVDFIQQMETTAAEETQSVGEIPSFSSDVMPLFEVYCTVCHGQMGGWNAGSYDSVINSEDNKPVVIPGDVENSLLAQKLLGIQTEGSVMPPAGKLADSEIQIVLDWIAAGAPDN